MLLSLVKIEKFTYFDSFCEDLSKSFKYAPTVILDLAVILAILQILDGCFTSIGVSCFGIEAEGNPILQFLMQEIGHNTTLIVTKSLAILIIAYLASIAHIVKWVKFAFVSVIGIYLTFAIFPWAAILSKHLL